MARDYSSRRNNPPDKHGKRKPTKRAAPAAKSVRKKPAPAQKKKSGGNRKAPARAGTPGCIWLVSGLLIAVVCGSVYYIASRPPGHGPESMSVDVSDESATAASDEHGTSVPKKSAARSAGSDDAAESQSKPRFSFYKMLPNYKVEVPANERSGQAKIAKNAPHEAEPAPVKPTPAATQTASSSHSGPPSASAPDISDNAAGYVIQAGAFSTHDDADHRKARLALLGVTADIVDIRTSSGKTVYRVQSSALSTRDKARNLAQRLESHGIETMVRQTR